MTSAVDIRIPDIEKELRTLWNSSLANKQLKASLFTILIYARASRRVQYFHDLVDSILDRFPCRIIFIHADDATERSYLHVSVSNLSSSTGPKPGNIACDNIAIQTSIDQLERIPFLVTPHIVPDLPLYLLWGESSFSDNVIFKHFAPFATRIIFDSGSADKLSRFCLVMQDSLKHLNVDLMDINWALLSNWRDLLYQLFQSRDRLCELGNAKSIKILYQQHEDPVLQHGAIRSLYLQGWLAARLNWQFLSAEKSRNTLAISYLNQSKEPLVVSLESVSQEDLAIGSINEMKIETPLHSFLLKRKPKIAQVEVMVSSQDTCDIPFSLPLPNVHRGLPFLKEIFYKPLGDHYGQMLKSLALLDANILNI